MILLSDVVAQVESGDCLDAIRYEPSFVPSENAISNALKYASGCWISATTAKMLCMTSWGKYQIMGANLYDMLGMKDSIFTFISNRNLQYVKFQLFLLKIGFKDVPFFDMSQQDLINFGVKYNGNGPVYAKALNRAYEILIK